MTDRRRKLGAIGEGLARRHLEARGYSLLECNFRTRYGEIDLVVSDNRALVFCEVKTRVVQGSRPGPFGPFASVGPRKRRQVRRIAGQWLAQRGRRTGEPPGDLRFDAIGVTLSPAGRLIAIDHLEGAF